MNTFPVNVEIPYIVPPKLEKDVIQLVELNYTNMIFKNFRPNDYHGMVIAGGSGIGKTRAGIEISRVLKKHPDYQPLIAAKTLYVRHVFLRQLCSPLNLPSQANTENAFYRDAKGMQSQGVDLYSDEEQEEVENLIDLNYKFFHKSKYLNHSEDNLTAGRALALGIATYYFTGRWGTTVQKKMLKIDRSFSDLTTVIKLIRRDLGAIDDRSHLIIFVQVDEFQLDPKLTVAMLRFLTEYIAEGNFTNESTVLIPIMTGTSSILIENMEGSATMYSLRHHFLSPLGKKISCELVASSAHYHAAIKSRNVMYTEVKENTNTLVSVLIDACGGVAICLIQLGYFLGSFFPGELDASENIKELWKDLVNWATTKYHKAVWEKCFLGEKNLLKWMTYVHFQWKVTRNTIINSITVGTYEHRGIIFLKGDDDDELTACFPLIFINTIASIYKLRFLEILLNPLCRLDEDSFPDFIMAKHYSGYYLLRQAGYTTVQFREIYGNFVRGSQQLLNKNITIHEDVRLFSTPIVRPKCPGEYSEFEKPQISDRKKIEVIAEGEKYKEKIIDSTSGKFIICIAKRSKTADAILPHADEQYKYVAALSSGHQLPASAVCQINMEVVLNEIKKAIGHTAFV
ncbi:15394_t:CDS:1 [Funneliformis geosporum]|nr:15394_t:CDS:1 [Funneliformis geosporum]